MIVKDNTVTSVVYLRAIAALGVCVLHFQLNTGLSVNKFIDYIIKSGNQGVTIFFVISGFILPLSLYRKGYEIKGYFNFILKRSLRVDPPYWFSIILLFTIGYYPLSAIEPDTLFYHITYLIPFISGQRWFTTVYWTLAIEFQFYLLLGLLFPLLIKANKYVVIALLLLLSCYCLRFTTTGYIAPYLYLFVFGYLAFISYSELIKRRYFFVALITLTLLICSFKSIISGLIPFFTVLAILFVKPQKREPVTFFLGTISYSIYLVHIPVMDFLKHLLANYALSPLVLCAIFTATVIPAAYLIYLVIEKPALKLSKSVVITRKKIPAEKPTVY
ncbi:acyltransferase family protein [Mucilaginibacter sp. HD30]